MISPTNILKQIGNFGGIRRAELIFECDILSFPAYNPFSQVYTGSINLKTGTRPYFIYFSKKSGRLGESGNIGSDAGDYFEQNISLKTPKYRPDLRLMIDRLKNNRVAIAIQDFNGYWTMHRNLRVRPVTDTGVKAAYNGTTFNCIGQSVRPSGFWAYTENPYITDTIPTGEQPPISTDPDTPAIDCCAKTYIHTQTSSALTWTIAHNLGADIQRPVIRIGKFDLEVESAVKRIEYVNDNTLKVTFKTEMTGKVFITEFVAP